MDIRDAEFGTLLLFGGAFFVALVRFLASPWRPDPEEQRRRSNAIGRTEDLNHRVGRELAKVEK